MDNQLFEKELKNFLDNEGRLISYPSKLKLKIIALFYLASKFESGKKYSEKEINQILQNWHTFEDWAMLRRDMYDRGFLSREPNCSVYWLEDNQPTIAMFGLD
ncbi:MAG: DUF2087 domain-containing protein [Oscillospiraceae bacterium]|jgi:hypothetical protein|nr:DUF2087 domain-containing protein [Oscillospiraceae bacterium]